MALLDRLNRANEPEVEEGEVLATSGTGGRIDCLHAWQHLGELATPADFEVVQEAGVALADHWSVPEAVAVYLRYLLPGELLGPHQLMDGSCFHVEAERCGRCSRVQLVMRHGLQGHYRPKAAEREGTLRQQLSVHEHAAPEEGETLATAGAGGRVACRHEWRAPFQPETPGEFDLLDLARAELANHWGVAEGVGAYLWQLLPGELLGAHRLHDGTCFNLQVASCRNCSRLQLIMRHGVRGQYHGARGATWLD